MKYRSKSKRSRSRFPAILGGVPAFKNPLPITVPTIPPIDPLKKKYEKVLKSGMITNSNNVQEFEKRVAKYLEVKHAVALNSCTSGLILIMKILKLKGEIIIPSFTFHATAHAAIWNGLSPVFVDCDEKTYNIDPLQVEKSITSRTSAILAVHIFGNPANIDALEKISKKHNLKLIFDAAHGFGSKFKGKNVGGFGDAESFSLSPTKLLTAGEGGIVSTNDDYLAKQLRIGRNYGDSGNYDCEFSGFNARMNEFSAILGIESLKRLEKNVEKRNKMVKLYMKLLAEIPGITFQEISDENQSSFKDFSILIDEERFGLNRDVLLEAMMAENIVVKKYFYPPVHMQKAFSGHKSSNDLKSTIHVAGNVLSLPLFSHISTDEVKKICFVLENIYQNRKKIGK